MDYTMEDRRVKSTLEKLQATYEEKTFRIEQTKSSIKEKQKLIEDLCKQQPILATDYAECCVEAATLQRELAQLHSEIGARENKLLTDQKNSEENQREIDWLIAGLQGIMEEGERSLRCLEAHHSEVQDLHNTLEETYLMMIEENLVYEYELNDYQAMQALADEMEIEDLQRQVAEIQEVKREVQNQLSSYSSKTYTNI